MYIIRAIHSVYDTYVTSWCSISIRRYVFCRYNWMLYDIVYVRFIIIYLRYGINIYYVLRTYPSLGITRPETQSKKCISTVLKITFSRVIDFDRAHWIQFLYFHWHSTQYYLQYRFSIFRLGTIKLDHSIDYNNYDYN